MRFPRRGMAQLASGSVDRWHRRRLRGRRPRLFVYTDSRGFDVQGRWGPVAFRTYIGALRAKYVVDYRIRPEPHTTFVDFLDTAQSVPLDRYDAVVVHCGIVDFSPRPLSGIERVKESKAGRPVWDELFALNQAHYDSPWPTLYQGEPTINLYSQEYLRDSVIPKLRQIDNLIWISSNRFVPGWEGNYAKVRPGNIDDVVSSFESNVADALTHVVDLRRWSHDEIKRYTIDNIHFTRKGFDQVTQMLERQLANVTGHTASVVQTGSTVGAQQS